ncbi:MarR family transcriptional regulator [Commensalibacter nepenthis]|uniref:MarR family transcriptional regulator n=1 Tax=Commensalibacter nepenthis TaxID=3043872 RepID=A0ABT6Q832_9PROT|nr:MarR family transcriptional regulator [Commensalibacter sp. TBRC 10068]MDI2113044.1 MarR family transcriptional regulator [Commensalibacter sp. TBRC 10068]
MIDQFKIIKKAAMDPFLLIPRQLAILSSIYVDGIHESVMVYAEKYNLSKPAVTRALDRLEECQLIERKVDREDRRKIIVTPTPQGQEYINNLMA